MGKDKALLEIEDRPFIQQVAETLQSAFDAVFIISDHGQAYHFLNIPIYEDVYKDCGPLGGIHSALSHSPTDKVFIVPCDVPLLKPSTMKYLPVDSEINGDVSVVSVSDNIQPLIGLYDRKCLPMMEHHLKHGQYSVATFLNDVKTTIIDLTTTPGIIIEQMLLNVNTLDSYQQLLSDITSK